MIHPRFPDRSAIPARRTVACSLGNLTARWLTFALLITLSNQVTVADPLSVRDDFAQRLRERHTGIVDGQPLRVAIHIVANSQTPSDNHINVWLDRKVNPDAPVSPSALGPTRYASLVAIAEQARCVVYPVDNCVLVGRPAWVAALARRIFLADDSSGAPATNLEGAIDLRWPDLTTPTEAFRLAQGHSADLPHDLWPASELRDISPRLAQQLITGQFLSQAELSAVGAAFPRSYRFPGSQELLPSLRQLDPNLKAGLRSGQLHLTGSLAVHQLFCAKILSVPSEDSSPPLNKPQDGNALERLQASDRVFQFTADDAMAGAMIKALTAQLGIECEFDPKANPQLEKIIPIKAEDQTIYEIVRLIADKASLKIQAAGDKLRVSAQ